jgi:hypothetical protein
MSIQGLRSLKQLAAECPAFTEGSLRWLVFNAPTNGLAPALVRIGSRVLIDRDAFQQWVFSHRQAAASQASAGAAPRPAARKRGRAQARSM